jgi:hypothetical protein
MIVAIEGGAAAWPPEASAIICVMFMMNHSDIHNLCITTYCNIIDITYMMNSHCRNIDNRCFHGEGRHGLAARDRRCIYNIHDEEQ